MALRNIFVEGDEILTKISKKIDEITPRTCEQLDDMLETLHDSGGVGIAAPQVGLLKRMVIIEPEEGNPIELINPKIVRSSGEQEAYEGCLSVPGYIGKVKRPKSVTVEYQDRTGKRHSEIFNDFAATIACHEVDHLDGILYTSKCTDLHVPEPDEVNE